MKNSIKRISKSVYSSVLCGISPGLWSAMKSEARGYLLLFKVPVAQWKIVMGWL
jgi:hypothetical protein